MSASNRQSVCSCSYLVLDLVAVGVEQLLEVGGEHVDAGLERGNARAYVLHQLPLENFAQVRRAELVHQQRVLALQEHLLVLQRVPDRLHHRVHRYLVSQDTGQDWTGNTGQETRKQPRRQTCKHASNMYELLKSTVRNSIANTVQYIQLQVKHNTSTRSTVLHSPINVIRVQVCDSTPQSMRTLRLLMSAWLRFTTPMMPSLTGITSPLSMSIASVPWSMRSSLVSTQMVRAPSGSTSRDSFSAAHTTRAQLHIRLEYE